MVGCCWFNNEKRKSQSTKIRNTEYLYIMYKNGKLLINESERNKILGLYQRPTVLESIVITDWLSPDEKYCIFLDELYDIEKKEKMGNVWENFDNFKFFLKHSFEVSQNIPQQIKEDVIKTLDSFLITESNQNMIGLKSFIKESLNEGFFDWVKEKGQEALQGIVNFGKTSWEGVQKTYGYIKDGDWVKAFDIIKKGVLYVARSIRSALYHPVGLVLDAILIATGVGKSVQWIPWAIVVALDVYEFTTGNYEEADLPDWMRILFYGIDILGLVTTGAIAIGARRATKAALGGVKTTEEASKVILKNSFLKRTLQTILGGLERVKPFLENAVKIFSTKFPKLSSFIGSIIGGLKRLINSIRGLFGKSVSAETIKQTSQKTLKQKIGAGTKAGLKTTGVVYGLEKGTEKGLEFFTGRNLEVEKLTKQSIDNYIASGGNLDDW